MWIIKKFDDPGENYGRYQVGYFEPIGGDHIFRGIGTIYKDDNSGLNYAMTACNYLNGGLGYNERRNIEELVKNTMYQPGPRPTHTSDGYPL